MSRETARPGGDAHSDVDRVWRAREGLLYRRLVDGGILYDDLAQEVHHFNATAALVWEQCNPGGRLADLVARLCERYEVDATRARVDARAILQELSRAGLLQP